MVELAVALSLHEQEDTPALQNLRHHLLVWWGWTHCRTLPAAGAPNEGHLSDTTASAPGSDD